MKAPASLYASAETLLVEVPGAIRERLALTFARFAPTVTSTRRRFVLLHGNPSHLDHWAATVPFLRTHGEVVAFDLPGFGRSDAPHGPLSLDLLADTTLALLDALTWDSPVVLVGQSHGAAVAHTFAARHPARVQSAVLLGAMGVPAHRSIRLAGLPGVETLTHWVAQRMNHQPYRALADLVSRAEVWAAFSPDPVPVGFRERESALVARRPEIQRSSVRCNDGDPTRQLLAQSPRIRTPLLFVHGRRDRLVPIAYARRLFDAAVVTPHASRFVSVEGGHMVHLVNSAVVHPVLEAWLASTGR